MDEDHRDRADLLREIGRLRAEVAALRADRSLPQIHRLLGENCLIEVADHIREVFWVFDWKQRRPIYVSPAFEEIWGRPVHAIFENPELWRESIHPDDHPAAQAAMEAVESSGREYQWQYRLTQPDGSIRWVSERAYAVRDEAGAVVRVMGVTEDITSRRQAEAELQQINDSLETRIGQRTAELEEEIERRRHIEAELRDSEAKYRALVESAGETIAVVDRDGVFRFMNQTAAARLGGRPEDFIGKTMWELFPEPTAERQVAGVRRTIETGESLNTIVLVDVGDQQRWYNTTVAPIRDPEDTTQAALIVARDVHDLKLAQQQVEQYQQYMRQAERLASVGTLSATVAHELTQPLTVIRLSIQSAMAKLRDTSCPPAALEALRDGLDGVADVVSRVERFRNYARQSTRANPCRLRLSDIVGRTFALLRDKARINRIALHAEGLDALPAIHADPKDIEQMCFALTENAIQAADGRQERRLTIKGHTQDNKVILSFEDTCGGIPAENLSQIFQPFFTTKALNEGTGLGLCIVEGTLSRLGGKISVETNPTGSTFHVTLPLP